MRLLSVRVSEYARMCASVCLYVHICLAVYDCVSVCRCYWQSSYLVSKVHQVTVIKSTNNPLTCSGYTQITTSQFYRCLVSVFIFLNQKQSSVKCSQLIAFFIYQLWWFNEQLMKEHRFDIIDRLKYTFNENKLVLYSFWSVKLRWLSSVRIILIHIWY